jgi:protein TonB
MSLRAVLIGGSLFLHGVMVVALGGIRATAASTATSIEVFESKKQEPPPPAKVETPPPDPPVPHEQPRAKAKATPAPPPPEAAPPPPSGNNLGALPDFGLELSGGGGGGGLAVPRAAQAAPTPAPTTKTLSKTLSPVKAADTCDEPPAKPKLVKLPQPAYTDSARAAGIEGKVRLEITVDENGKVVDVKPLTSLGHGLDEAAVAAARAATFEAAVRCGRPSRSTFTVSIRFSTS